MTWVHSYVTDDRREDVLHLRRAEPRGDPHRRRANGLPVEQITEVRVLDPYFYIESA